MLMMTTERERIFFSLKKCDDEMTGDTIIFRVIENATFYYILSSDNTYEINTCHIIMGESY